jgi:hypothetical protein
MLEFVHTPIRYNLSFFVTHDDIRYNHDTMLFLCCIAAPCEQGWRFLRKRNPQAAPPCPVARFVANAGRPRLRQALLNFSAFIFAYQSVAVQNKDK